MNVDPNQLKYVIFPSTRKHGCNFSSLHDKVFQFWHQLWTKTFASTGDPATGWEDHFVRQNYIVAILHKSDVVGCHLYTYYDLTALSTKHSEYFSYVAPEAYKNLSLKGWHSGLTMEYLCIAPEYQRNSEKISFGKLMVSLGCRLAEEYGIDCTLGMPIEGTKVQDKMENVGGLVIQSDIEKYGYNLKLLACPSRPSVTSQDEIVKNYTYRLWENREDFVISNQPLEVA